MKAFLHHEGHESHEERIRKYLLLFVLPFVSFALFVV